MPIKLTPAQAKALGLEARTKIRQTRKTIKGEPYWSRCTWCDETFTTQAAETRHVEETKHTRYEVLT